MLGIDWDEFGSIDVPVMLKTVQVCFLQKMCMYYLTSWICSRSWIGLLKGFNTDSTTF